MKYFAILLLSLSSLKAGAQGAQEMVKQRAIQQRDLNNQQQGVTTPPAAGGSTSYITAPVVPAQPTVSPAQQALIDHLDTDLAKFKEGAPATDAEKLTLQNDLAGLSKSTTKPTNAQFTKLSQDLATALSEKNISTERLALLAKNLNVIMNSTVMTPAKAQAYISAAQSLLKSGGVSETNSTAVANDLKAIVMQIQNNKPKLYQ